jgi:hypothetical protein
MFIDLLLEKKKDYNEGDTHILLVVDHKNLSGALQYMAV